MTTLSLELWLTLNVTVADRCLHTGRWRLELGVQCVLNGRVSGSQHRSVIRFQYAQCSIYHVCRCMKSWSQVTWSDFTGFSQEKKKKEKKVQWRFPAWQEPDKWRPEYLINPLPLLYYSIATSPSPSDDFHLGVGVDGDDVVALRRLDARFGVGLTVKIVLNEEVASLFEVDAAVITHEAVRVVELVSRLYYCATKRTDDWDKIRQFDAARLMRYVFSFSQ